MTAKTDTSLVCPECGASIEFTESLAAPFLTKVRKDYEVRLAEQSEKIVAERKAITEQQRANDTKALELDDAARRQERTIAEEVGRRTTEQLATDRAKIAAEEKERSRIAFQDELKTERENAEAQVERNRELTRKLTLSQQAEAGFLKKQRELEDKEREHDIKVQKEIRAGVEEARTKAITDAQAASDLKIKDKENTISQLKEQITALQRKAEQGSQQSQGESLELSLEHQLRAQFPFDMIEPVAKGESGADILQHVRDSTGQTCGKILWESKRTKAWSDTWLDKLKTDQRRAQADLAVIVSLAMPKHIKYFDQIDEIWVSSLSCIQPVANALRVSIIELSGARRAHEGQETKTQQVYTYLTGPRFKHRVQSIAEKFSELRSDLDKERKWMTKQWAKRDSELLIVLGATSGIWGDLQGIVGKNLTEIEALEGPLRLESEN